jgi:hypothetical protein
VSATHRTGTAVKGSASGMSYNAGLFGGVFRVGPTPHVRLAPDGSNSPQTANEETFHDGVITAGSPILTSASANFTFQDTARPITGAGIPAGATITNVHRANSFTPTATSITMSANATTTATGVTFTIVDRTVNMRFGPGIIFTAKGITVQTSGSVGPNWSVTSSADVQDVNTSRVEIFGEDRKDCCQPSGSQWPGDFFDDVPGSPTMMRPLTDIASSCGASGTGLTGSTTLANGWLYTDSGWSDYDPVYPEPADAEGRPAEHDPVKVLVPNNPAVGATYSGHIHVASNATDRYVIVFNEQIVRNGSITVNAAHFYYGYTLESGSLVVDQASTFKGEMVLGQSVCGVPHAAPRADFNGNGTTDLAVYRPSQGYWFVNGGATTPFGANGDIPVPGDYDGDGDTDIAVFRPSNGVWFVNGGPITAWGATGDIPVPGDYDGDGDTDMAVFRPSTGTWFIQGGQSVAWGTSGDIPVPGDYNGDGRTDVAVFRPSNGVWFVKGLINPTAFGTTGDIPVPGDYDDDGDTDLAVFRPANGLWFVNGISVTQYGTNGDIPVPLPDAIRRFFFPAL